MLLLELLHLLLELQIGGKRHLGQRGRVRWLLLLLLLLLGWLRGTVSTFQNGPALRLGHLWHLLLTRMGLLQVPRNVTTAGHSRLLLLLLRTVLISSSRMLLLDGTHRWNSNRMMRTTAHSRMLLVGYLRRRSLLIRWRPWRRMLSHEGAQITLLLAEWIVQAKIAENIGSAATTTATLFPVGHRSIADSGCKLFVLLFGGHFAQHRSRREGKRSRGRGVLVLVVVGMLLGLLMLGLLGRRRLVLLGW